jgi:hypothetical protein
VGTGKIVDPVADVRKLAALVPGDGTLTEVDDFAQANGLKFGKEAVASGVVTSYAAARAVEAAANPKERAPRKSKGLAATVAEVQHDGEAVAEAPVVNDHVDPVVAEVSEADKQEAKAARKSELQRQRKAKMKSSRIRSVK